MPTLKEETSRNPRDYDIPLNERIVHDIISVDLNINLPSKAKIYEKAFFADKLKELEIGIKVNTENYASNLLLALKRSSSARGKLFDPAKIKEEFAWMMEDYNNCARKLYEIDPNDRFHNYKLTSGLTDPLKFITVMFNRCIIKIDECINKCSISVKSVDSTEDILNKASYTSALYDPKDEDQWVHLSEEQEKIYNSGKDIFSKESLSLNIKKLRTFRSRVIRIYNKCFGKDSIYAPFNLHDAIINR